MPNNRIIYDEIYALVVKSFEDVIWGSERHFIGEEPREQTTSAIRMKISSEVPTLGNNFTWNGIDGND